MDTIVSISQTLTFIIIKFAQYPHRGLRKTTNIHEKKRCLWSYNNPNVCRFRVDCFFIVLVQILLFGDFEFDSSLKK